MIDFKLLAVKAILQLRYEELYVTNSLQIYGYNSPKSNSKGRLVTSEFYIDVMKDLYCIFLDTQPTNHISYATLHASKTLKLRLALIRKSFVKHKNKNILLPKFNPSR